MDNGTNVSQKDVLKFEWNLAARQNYFTLYLGNIIIALFLIICFISFIRKRKHSVVNLLARPDSDAHVHEYILMLKTSLRMGAGLTPGARVAVQLLGTYSDSQRYTLSQQFMKQNILHRAHVDIFVLYTQMELGDVRTVRCTMFNFSQKQTATWRPCYMEVMKSTTRERWGVKIKKKLSCQHITNRTYRLIKGLRDKESFVGLIMKNHIFTAPFFNPQRFGAFSTLTSVIFFFFCQSVLLVTSLFSFILGHQFLGSLSNATFTIHFVRHILPVIMICSLVVWAVIQQIETFLRNIRPSPSRRSLRLWRGLWRNDYPGNLMYNDVTYKWNLPPDHFRSWADKFSSRMSLSSLSSISKSSNSSPILSEDSAEEQQVGEVLKPAGTPVAETAEEKARAAQATIDSALKLLRGDDLYSYVLSLIHQVRRAIQALRITNDPDVAIRVLTLCLNQWTSSLCTRMLKETMLKLEKEQMDAGGLHHVHSSLLNCESNLWFTEVGYREGPYAGRRKGDNARKVSSLYFSIMRHLVSAWKNKQKGVRGILRRPNRELFPSDARKKKIKFESKVQKKSIVRIVDLMEIMKTSQTNLAPGSAGGPDKNESARRSTQFDAQNLSQSANDSVHFTELASDAAHQHSSSEEKKEERRTVKNVSQSAGETSSTVPTHDFLMSDCGHLFAQNSSQTGGPQGGDDVNVRTSTRQKHWPGGNSCRSALSPSGDDSDPQPKTSEGSPTSSTHGASGQPLNSDQGSSQRSGPVLPPASSLSHQGELTDPLTDDQTATDDDSVIWPDDVLLEEDGDSRGENVCSSHNPLLYGESDWCNSHETSKNPLASASKFSEDVIRKMSSQVMSVFKKKIRTVVDAHPETIFKLLAALESYANVVQLEVRGPFGTSSCFCCAKALCQTYAVLYSQLKEDSYRVLYHLVAHCISTRHHQSQEVATMTRYYKKTMTGVTSYILRRARLMQKLGMPQNDQAISRLEKELKVPEKKDEEYSSSHSYGSLDSLDRSGNNPSQSPVDKKRGKGRARKYSAFMFGKQKAHHGLIVNWSHVPYPFTPTILPPIYLHWPDPLTDGSHNAQTHIGESVKNQAGLDAQSARVDFNPNAHVDPATDQPPDKPDAAQPTTKTDVRFADSTKQAKKGDDDHGSSSLLESTQTHKALHKFVKKMLHEAIQDVTHESRWLLGLRESLASVVAFARMDVSEEVQDPLKIAIRNFTHALLVLLFEALLPKDEEENFEVTPDDIRQRRKRVSSKRSPGLFDLTEYNNPGYDLNFLDFVVVQLCEKWELAKVELQHEPTLRFLTRCLTMTNLDMDLMQELDHLILINRESIQGLVLDRLTHVHETQHSVAVVVNEAMAMTLVYVVPETLKAMKDVTGWLRNEEERVAYVCEKVSVMENQVRHKLARHVLKAASRDVQDQLIVLDRRQEKIREREDRMINKLRELVKEDYYFTDFSKDEVETIKKELMEARHIANTINKVHTFQKARAVRKYAQNTTKLQQAKVRETLNTLTDDRHHEKEYSRRQLAEVEWIMTGQVDKQFPSIWMSIALWFMFVVTLCNLILLTILGASFSPKDVGEWFGIHAIAVGLIVFLAEPIKCVWLLDFGWIQPE